MHSSIATGLAVGLAVLGATRTTPSHAQGSIAEEGYLVYDLAVTSLDVTQTKSTPLFRDVDVLCVVENLGPNAAPPKAEITISRPSDDGPKILKRTVIPTWLMKEARFEVRVKTSVWHTSTVPYRCEVLFPTDMPSPDANPGNNAKERVFPKP
jgi:hypothetical protein